MSAVSAVRHPADLPDLETPDGLARHGFRAMGTSVTLLLPASAPSTAVGAIRALFERWEAALSRFRPQSELSRLNAAAGCEVLVGDLLLDVTRSALGAAEATDGLFDPTLLHELLAAGYDRSFDLLPAERSGMAPGFAAAPAERRTSWRHVRIDPLLRSITLPVGTGLDLGGIAKGMAVDAAVEALAAAGLSPCVVEAGGDLAVHGMSGDAGWAVAVETGDTVTTILLDRGALATSSIRRRRWTVDGEVRHHLINPRTRRPAATDLESVTVAAGTCREAEVAAKCALVLGEAAGTAFLGRLGLTGLVVREDGRMRAVGDWALEAGDAA